jgi:tetratricopeptide (TPR) repeat protein
MNMFSLYYIISMLTGSPLLAILILFLLYGFIDKMYIRLLPDFFAPLRRNRQIRSLLTELSINRANSKASLDLGVLYFEKKKYDRALEYLKKAGERIDDSARLCLYTGMSYYESGQEAEGVEHIKKALELDKGIGYGLPYIYLIGYEMKTGENRERLSSLEEAFDSFANTENFYRMGMIYKGMGNKAKAGEMFNNALKSYSYVPRTIKKLHRRWAVYSWIHKRLV